MTTWTQLLAVIKGDLHFIVGVGTTSGRKSPSSCGSQQSKVAPKPGGVQIMLWVRLIKIRWPAEMGQASPPTHDHQDVHFICVFSPSEQQ